MTLLTNSAGQDVGHYRYDAFGNTLEVWGSRGVENPYRFSTKEWHAASGLYDYGFRFYSPGLGRWLNRDPLEEEGGVNLYGFVDNNPINSVDEYGLNPKKKDPRPCMNDNVKGSCQTSSVTTLPGIKELIDIAEQLGQTGTLKPYAERALETINDAKALGRDVRKTKQWKADIASDSPRHHIFPQKFRAKFESIFGTDKIDDFTLQVPKYYHKFLHHTVKWNNQWEEFFKAHKTPSSLRVNKFARQMMDDAGLQSIDWSELIKYKSKR